MGYIIWFVKLDDKKKSPPLEERRAQGLEDLLNGSRQESGQETATPEKQSVDSIEGFSKTSIYLHCLRCDRLYFALDIHTKCPRCNI